MLELIVLGQVPGTSLQINFTGIILLSLSLYILAKVLGSYFRYHRFMARFGHVARYFALVNKKAKS